MCYNKNPVKQSLGWIGCSLMGGGLMCCTLNDLDPLCKLWHHHRILHLYSVSYWWLIHSEYQLDLVNEGWYRSLVDSNAWFNDNNALTFDIWVKVKSDIIDAFFIQVFLQVINTQRTSYMSLKNDKVWYNLVLWAKVNSDIVICFLNSNSASYLQPVHLECQSGPGNLLQIMLHIDLWCSIWHWQHGRLRDRYIEHRSETGNEIHQYIK